MSAYKRFVSYLYEYDNRKKGKNRGFVRVEVRNHQCCLELHMTLPACPFIPVFRAYAFVARPGTLHGLFLGNPSWKQGNVYGQFRIADTSICNSSWNLDDIDGLIVVCETGQRYATCWSDCKISPEDLLLPESAPILRAASLEQPESPGDKHCQHTPGSRARIGLLPFFRHRACPYTDFLIFLETADRKLSTCYTVFR